MLITDHLKDHRHDASDRARHPARTSDPRVLIADDQADVLEALRLLLKAEGFHLETASSPAGVLAALEAREFDVSLIDLNYARDTTSGEEGLNLLSRIQGIDPTLPVVVMTAWGSVEVAVEAMRRGARDFIQKPWDNARLLAIIRTQIELSQALRKGQRLEAENSLLRGEGMPNLVAESPAMQGVLQVISRVGPSDANVLVLGENGTGKGVVARALHAVSSRASRPMVIVNSGGVSEGVFESELFGHVRGAFTDAKADRVGRFELADLGTLFLDEIANVPDEPAGQAAARDRDRRVRAARLVADAPRRRPHHLGHQRRPHRGSGDRPLPPGPAVPAQHHRDPPAPRCAIAARICRCSRSTSCASTRSATASASPASRAARCSSCSSTRGRATCASSITPSSARC